MKRAVSYIGAVVLVLAAVAVVYRPGAERSGPLAAAVSRDSAGVDSGFARQLGQQAEVTAARAIRPAAAPPLVDPDQALLHEVRVRLLIRTATMSLRVDSLGPALEQVRHVAQALDAIVVASDTHTGAGERHVATIGLRVRSERFDRLLEGIRRLGAVDALSVNLEDVGSE